MDCSQGESHLHSCKTPVTLAIPQAGEDDLSLVRRVRSNCSEQWRRGRRQGEGQICWESLALLAGEGIEDGPEFREVSQSEGASQGS